MNLWLISDRSTHDLLGVHFPTMCVLQSIHPYTVHYIIIFELNLLVPQSLIHKKTQIAVFMWRPRK